MRERVGAAQGEHAGAAVVAAGDAVLVGEVQRVAGHEARDRHRGARQRRVVGVAQRQAGSDDDGRALLGEAHRSSRRHHRGVVDRGDVQRAGRGTAVQGAVIDGPGDRAAGVGAEAGRVVAGRGESDRLQRRLVIGDRGAAGEGEHAGAAVVAAGDAVLGAEVQRVAGEEAADRDRGTRQRRAVGVAQRQAGIENG